MEKYHFEEGGLAVDLILNADRSATYSVGGSVGIRAEGAWDVRGYRNHSFHKPEPVKLEPAGSPNHPYESAAPLREVV